MNRRLLAFQDNAVVSITERRVASVVSAATKAHEAYENDKDRLPPTSYRRLVAVRLDVCQDYLDHPTSIY